LILYTELEWHIGISEFFQIVWYFLQLCHYILCYSHFEFKVYFFIFKMYTFLHALTQLLSFCAGELCANAIGNKLTKFRSLIPLYYRYEFKFEKYWIFDVSISFSISYISVYTPQNSLILTAAVLCILILCILNLPTVLCAHWGIY